MQQKNDNPSFFDSKTIIAIASVALVYFGWQSYLTKKYPQYGKKAAQTEQAQTQVPVGNAPSLQQNNPVEAKSEVIAPQGAQEQIFKFSNDKVSFALTNFGMGLKDFTVNNYLDKEKKQIKLGVSDKVNLFEMRWTGDLKPLVFNVTEQEPGHYVGIARVGTTQVTRDLKFNPETSSFVNKVVITNPTEDFKKGFSLLIPEKIHGQGKSSFLFPSYEHQDFFVIHDGGKEETINFNKAKSNLSQEFLSTSVLSVSSQYFAAAIKDKSDIIPEVKVSAGVSEQTALAELFYKPVQLNPEMIFSEIFYAGPKSIDSLKAVDAELSHIIDFGFFGFIARPLLYVMKGFYSVVGNWGFSIILLTLLVRLCVLPFNIMSFRSMKAMQKVQPIIQSLREKYKDDPMRLNQEMMVVMKENGANPLGGCLPMLLQIPVFFALYRVIGSSIELYNSPFIGWIHDLSAHDPFYVLPVLMAVFMFIQQKITPSTMDPTQAKIMAFLPLVFSLFMLQLPSGLTLYMVVSTLFGITQQYLIMREKKPTAI
ncbi:MAG: membrane protein insertase YidC [Pseudobdellovibrionaceae bacterium]